MQLLLCSCLLKSRLLDYRSQTRQQAAGVKDNVDEGAEAVKEGVDQAADQLSQTAGQVERNLDQAAGGAAAKDFHCPP